MRTLPLFALSTLALLAVSGCSKDATDDSGSDTGLVDPADQDGDGFREEDGDCNDEDAAVNPAAEDTVGDEVDQNCDGSDGVDADGDGWASEASGGSDCDDSDAALQPADADEDGYSTCDGDCDDTDAALQPGDADSDGYSTCDGDCDDTDAALQPGDADGDGYSTCEGDCDDEDAGLHPHDADGDGFSSCDGDCDDYDPSLDLADADNDGYSSCDGDCNDANESIHPGAADSLITDRDCDGTAPGGLMTSADYKFLGENSNDRAGENLAFVGDVDGDGLDDMLFGSSPFNSYKGAAYLVLSGSLESSSTLPLHKADYFFEGVGGSAGSALSGAGDVDGDGLADLLIGAYTDSEVYLVLGSSLGSEDEIRLDNADHVFTAPWSSGAGYSVASAGDVDGDSLDDILIGAPFQDEAGQSSGETYLVLASSLGSGGSFDLQDADYTFVGEAEYDLSGYSVAGAGDVDGDGLDDVLVAAHDSYDQKTEPTAVYVVLGSSLGSSASIDLSMADYKLVGETVGDKLGLAVSGAGDLDGDGLADLLLGARYDDENGVRAGASYVVLGSSLGTNPVVNLSDADYKFLGEAAYDTSGFSLAGAGDVDGDGLDDIWIGSQSAQRNGYGSGSVHLVLGASLGGASVIDLADADLELMGVVGDSRDFIGGSIGGGGDADGDGRGDLLLGTPSWDQSSGGGYLVLTGG